MLTLSVLTFSQAFGKLLRLVPELLKYLYIVSLCFHLLAAVVIAMSSKSIYYVGSE